jgi:uncharacterized Zn ribbon protein
MRLRRCENCNKEFLHWHAQQRWCCIECRIEFKNNELRTARELWKREDNKEMILEEMKQAAQR